MTTFLPNHHIVKKLAMDRSLYCERNGQVRVSGSAPPGLPLLPMDLDIEVCGIDGEWRRLRGITSFKLELLPNEPARLRDMTIELGMLDILVPPEQLKAFGVPMGKRSLYETIVLLAQDVRDWWSKIEWP